MREVCIGKCPHWLERKELSQLTMAWSKIAGFLDEARWGSLPPSGGQPDCSTLLYKVHSPGCIIPLTLPAYFSPVNALEEHPRGIVGIVRL